MYRPTLDDPEVEELASMVADTIDAAGSDSAIAIAALIRVANECAGGDPDLLDFAARLLE